MRATLFPRWDWRGHRELWSGKRGRAGMNDPDPGPARRRDSCGPRPLFWVHARRGRTGRLRTARRAGPLRVDRRQGVCGKGNDRPAQEAPNGELSEAAKEANKSVNRIRQVVERTIAHIKAPENLSRTAYRRLLGTFEQTITAALALYVFKTTPE